MPSRRSSLFSSVLAFLILFLALPALAGNWGEDWGEMTWGEAIAAVPLTGKVGFFFLVLALIAVGTWVVRARGSALSGLMLLALPVLVAAGPESARADAVILDSGTCEESGYLSITTPADCLAAGALTTPAINGGAASDQPPEGYGDTSEWRAAGCTVHNFQWHAGGHTQFFPHATGACGTSNFNCICLDEGYTWEDSDLPHVFNAGDVAEAGKMNANQAILRNALNGVLQSSEVTPLHTFVNGEMADANEVNENFEALKTGVETCLSGVGASAGNEAVCQSVGGTWLAGSCTAAPCDVTSNDVAVAAAAAAAVDITTDNAVAYAEGAASVDITSDNAAVAAAAAAAVDITTDNAVLCTTAGGMWDPGMTSSCAPTSESVCQAAGGTWGAGGISACCTDDSFTVNTGAVLIPQFVDQTSQYCGSSVSTSNGATLEQCAALCLGNASCDYFTSLEANNGHCVLSSTCDGTQYGDGSTDWDTITYQVSQGYTVLSGGEELLLLDDQYADISAADLGDWGTNGFDLRLSLKAGPGGNIAADGDYAALFVRSSSTGTPNLGPMAFVYNDGRILFRLRSDDQLFLPAGTVSSWADWVDLRFVHVVSTDTLQIFVNEVLVDTRDLTTSIGTTYVSNAPLRFGAHPSGTEFQNLNARIRDLVRIDFDAPLCTEVASLEPLSCDAASEGCTVGITSDNQSVCEAAGGAWDAGTTSSCTPPAPASDWVCDLTVSPTASLGTLTANYAGGTPPHSYAWDGSASSETTSTVTGMPPGPYNVTVTDVNGCAATSSTSWSCGLTVSSTSSLGTLTASGSNGLAPYSYQWDASANNQTTATATGLTTGVSYQVTVTDVNGCTATASGIPLPLAVGDTYQGGIIFYLDGNGTGGLIAAPSNQSRSSWSGAINICNDLTLGGYNDWFLPSKNQLMQMYLNIGQGNALDLGNVGGFTSHVYWSSTESGSSNAWYQVFGGFPDSNGSQNTSLKFNSNYVRAVRAF